ncbi:BTAD domain-containing putative transcriptional regulator [Brevundimonas sp. Root1423]|uniref:BTAD domain-containing putative transcriptional regulator n=1 Tax=Brevundimonas sp. Root1423 TaxID=1736462 RepID=UPI0006F3DA5D|nr:BTAD domain-containing putative transcriptional regulator [Brevundimonas sp. Root1423]KQY89779.1 hypothetical protein ASD25_04410 [Brevundimonas sp. Root1423]
MALVAFLALQPGRRASRERLAALLWPDADATQARLNLRKALSLLRKVTPDGDDLFRAQGEQIKLRADGLECDVDALEAATRAPVAVDAPVDDLTGELLQDFGIRDAYEFEAWTRVERQRIRELQLALLTRRLDSEIDTPAGAESAVRTALRILQIDPLQEGARRVLMTLHARQGRSAAAMEQYRELADLLHRELGAQPEEETRTLYQDITRQRRTRPAPSQTRPPRALRETPATTTPGKPPARRGHRIGIAASLLLAALAGSQFSVQQSPETVALGPLTTILASEEPTRPAVSPNGEWIAHISRRIHPGNLDIYLRTLSGGDPVRLTTDPALDDNPAWSADGRLLAFTRTPATGDAPCRIIVMAPPNGHERIVGACRAVSSTRLSWAPDGKSIYFADQAAPGLPTSLFRLDVETGRSRALTTSPAEIAGDEAPTISPDGKMLAFLRRTSWTAANVYVLDLTKGRTRQLTTDGRRIWGLTWDRTGKGVYFSSNRSGDTALWWAPARRTGEAKRISVGLLDFRLLTSARARDRLIFEAVSDYSDLVQADAAGVRRPIGDTPWPAEGYSDWFADVAADGSLVMVSDRDGSERLWIQGADHGQPTAASTILDAVLSEPRWSPDSRRIAFVATRDGGADLYVADRRTGRITPLTADDADDASPVWSHDGRHLYFTSRRGGFWRIWRMNADGSGATPFSLPGPRAVRIDSSGRIYAVLDGRQGVWRLSLLNDREAGPRQLIVADQQSWDWLNWDIDRRQLFYVQRSPDGLSGRIRRRDLAGGRDESLDETTDLLLLDAFAVRPDGSLLLTRRKYGTRLLATDLIRTP